VTVDVRPYRKRGVVVPGALEYDIKNEHPDGTPIRERRKSKFRTESETYRWAYKREAELLAAGPKHARKQTPSLRDFWKDFKRIHFVNGPRGPLKPSQCASLESDWAVHIEPALGHLRLEQITPVVLASFTAKLQEPYEKDVPERRRSLKTVNNILTSLNTMLGRAVAWRVARELPRAKLFKLDKPKMEFYDFPEWERLVAGARAAGPKQLAVVLLGGRAGLRAGEILGLAPTDIDYKRRTINVQRAVWKTKVGKPKNGKARGQPVTREVLAALKALPVVGTERLFLRDDGERPASKETLRLWVYAAERRAGLADESRKGKIHKLRHTYASHLVMRGVALAVVQQLMDHSNIQTTMRYAHLAPREIDRAVTVLEDSAA
jgi:integrase